MKRNTLLILGALIIGATLCTTTSFARNQRGGGTPSLNPAAEAALIEALTGTHGEYAARAEYSAILEVYPLEVYPEAQLFANILAAEENHVAALEQQCANYGVEVSDPYQDVEFAGTLLDAALAGVAGEELNIEMYDGLLLLVEGYPSLEQVFTNLRAASLYNHLPAFEAAVENFSSLP